MGTNNSESKITDQKIEFLFFASSFFPAAYLKLFTSFDYGVDYTILLSVCGYIFCLAAAKKNRPSLYTPLFKRGEFYVALAGNFVTLCGAMIRENDISWGFFPACVINFIFLFFTAFLKKYDQVTVTNVITGGK